MQYAITHGDNSTKIPLSRCALMAMPCDARIQSIVSMLLMAPLAQLIGCGQVSRPDLQRFDPPTASAKAIELYDGNRDGKLAPDELKKSPALAASIRRIDVNRDGTLTAEEIQARFEELAKWAGYIALEMTVKSRGKPLVGADVKLTPEAFMGTDYPVFSGKTVEGGSCTLVDDGRGLPAVPVGFYTARVVHPAQRIDTVRGVEIAEDTTGSRLEIAL